VSSVSSNQSILLLAFRKSHKTFFKALVDQCGNEHFSIRSTKSSFNFSFKALRYLNKIDLTGACTFAVEEFYAKTNLKIPRVMVSFYFKYLAMINLLRYEVLLDIKYQKMLLWNGGKFRQRIVVEIAKYKGIKVYFFENGLLPNTLVFDEKGINYENSVPRNKAFYSDYHTLKSLPTALVPRVGKNRDIFKGEKKGLPAKYIFVPFQVDYDTQIISHSSWIKNMRMLFETISKLKLPSDIYVVFKEHPSSGVEYPDLYQEIQNSTQMDFQNTYSTQELIENSIAVITINSTVGVESLLFHKKVIVLGDAFYKIEGITLFANNQLALQNIIQTIEHIEIDTNLIDNFLKYLYYEYLIHKNEDYLTEIYHRLLDKRQG
jgi:capsular polysaccharide export protein